MKEKHICYYCGQEASYQLKNGNWCCKQNARGCPSIRNKVSKKAKEKWKELKKDGITNRNEIKKIKNLGIEGICYYCGKPAQYKLKNGRWCCCQNVSQCQQIKRKNSQKRKQQIKLNPQYWKRLNFINKHEAWNRGLTKETDERIKKACERFHERFEKGEIKIKGHSHTKETKEKLSKIRIQYLDKCNAGFQDVKWYKIKNILNEQYVVRGTWEKDVGDFLTKNNILWKKKIYLKYIKKDGSVHHYVPDFYIPEYDLYIQVKGYFNEYDKIKMELVKNQLKINIVYIKQKEIKKIRKNKLLISEILV